MIGKNKQMISNTLEEMRNEQEKLKELRDKYMVLQSKRNLGM